jgi:hypothetical protein
MGSSANYQNRSPIAPSGGSLVSASPQFGVIGPFENENYNWGLPLAAGGAWATADTIWDIGKSSFEAKKFHVSDWGKVGGRAAGTMFGTAVALGLFEAWRSNNAKTNNETMRKYIQASSRQHPVNTATQAKSLNPEQIAADFADNGTLDGSTKSA